MVRREYTDLTIKKLYGKSGNMCAFPSCVQELITPNGTNMSDISHIEGGELGSPRYNSNLSLKELNDYDNLVVFCKNHNKYVDYNESEFPKELLQKIKKNHEEKMRNKNYQIPNHIVQQLIQEFDQNQFNVQIGSGTQLSTQSGDIVNYQFTNTIDIMQLGEVIFDRNFPKIEEKITNIAKKSAQEFILELIKQGKEKLTVGEFTNFNDPDLQYMLTNSIISVGRNNDPNLKKHLASLMIDRIKNTHSDLKKIIYNEAIETLPKLTINHLKIIASCFLLRNVKFSNVIDDITFEKVYRPILENYLSFKESHAEIQYAVYTRVVSHGIGSWDFKQKLREYEGLNIENALQTKTGKDIMKILSSSDLTHLTLTSVGIAIAIMYYENITGAKVDADIFIN